MGRNKPARTLLNDVVQIIARDIEEIEKNEGEVDADMAQRLVKYTDALLKVVKEEEDRLEDERAEVAKMSNEELAALAAKLSEKK